MRIVRRRQIVTAVLLLTLTVLFSTSCATHAVSAPIPNQINSVDGWAWRVLYDAQAALNTFRADVTSGKVTETPAIKSAFNQAASDYNIAEGIYQSWRAAGGIGSTTQLTSSVNQVSADIAGIAAKVSGGGN